MARERRSLQDLIRSRQQSGFVGRQGQIVQYQENLGRPVDDEHRRFLFNIHGDAGVGKTYLTKQLRQLAADRGALTAYMDEAADDATTAMNLIAEQFKRAGAPLREFEKRASAYRRRRQELESDPAAPDDLAAFLTRTAVTIGLAAARDIPVAGSLLAPVDPAGAGDQVNRARMYLARRLSDHAEMRLLLSPVDELTPVFLSEVNRVAANRPLAVFVDTYERAGRVLDHWLRRLYDGDYGELPASLIVTISGQQPLDPNLWGAYLPVIADVPLKPFSDAEARQFLASRNITNENIIQVILNLSGRLPMWLATLAEARPVNASEVGDPAGDAVERFLKWEEDPARRQIALGAALPRMLNQDVLAEITQPDAAPALFGWLSGLPFVTRRAHSWAYHEVVRAAMLRLQMAQAPSEWKTRQEALARAHARWARDVSGKSWTNPRWIDHSRERTYHLLCADPVAHLAGALAGAVRAAEYSITRARQWADLIAEAGRDTDSEDLREWGRRLRDGLREDDLTSFLTCLINDGALDEESLAIALEERAEARRQAGRYEEAVRDFSAAIELNPSGTWAISGRGQTYAAMERYAEALGDYDRAIELDATKAGAIALRGETNRLTARYLAALEDFSRALELEPDYTWAVAHRGETNRLSARYEDALADFSRALELDSEYAWAIASRGQTYLGMGRYGDALADLDRAIAVDPSKAWIRALRGETNRLAEQYGDAIADFTRAIELDSDFPWALAHRGDSYRLAKRYDEAIADFDHALELDADVAWAWAHRGDTYRLFSRHEDALDDFSRALELEPSYAWAIASRGQTYIAMGRYDDALVDLDRAIELDPSKAWVIAHRGEAYRLTSRYDKAIADFTWAIELYPDYTWALAHRGDSYRLTSRYEEAIADFSHAIALTPEYTWAVTGMEAAQEAIEEARPL